MNEILLPFDVETTGLVRTKQPLNDPGQPHLVSASMLQVQADTYFVQQSMSKVVYPADWDWDDTEQSEDRAFQVHKLTLDHCSTYGRAEKEVLDEILHLWESSNGTLIAHNLKFDQNVIACAIARYYGAGDLLNRWLAAPGFCTMENSNNIVEARGKTGRRKKPNLKEAYEFFTGESLEEHHSANRDTVACLQVYAGIQEYGEE